MDGWRGSARMLLGDLVSDLCLCKNVWPSQTESPPTAFPSPSSSLLPRWEVPIWLTDDLANRRWHSGFFLSRIGGCRIHYLCPFQPLRNGGQRCTWLQRQAAHPSLSPRGPLMWQRHRSQGRGLPPAIPLGRPPALPPPGSTAIDPSSDSRSRVKSKQIHLVGSNNHPAPVGTGPGKLIVCLQRLDIVNVFAIDGAR